LLELRLLRSFHEFKDHRTKPGLLIRLAEPIVRRQADPAEMPLAGFAPDEIAITAEQNVLTVEGRKAEKAQPVLFPGEHRCMDALHLRPCRAVKSCL